MKQTLAPPTLAEITQARRRLAGLALKTPLIRLDIEDAPGEIFLKLENLQPIGSFKLRPAGNALAALDPAIRRRGVYTASSGNMAIGLAWAARQMGISAAAVVCDPAPQIKLDHLARLGARIIPLPFEKWWQVVCDHGLPGEPGQFIHPVCEPAVLAGDATLGAEIIEELPDVETIVAPFGGGGLSCGIAAAVRALKPEVRVLACEKSEARPLAAALSAGKPVPIPPVPSFITGLDTTCVLDDMWPLAHQLLDGTGSASRNETAAAIRLLAERAHVIAEGAGALPLAATLAGRTGSGKTVCVVSGGNINPADLAIILRGGVPD
jgi:threonine dehydratase